jgi:hypothetical protein
LFVLALLLLLQAAMLAAPLLIQLLLTVRSKRYQELR